MKNLFKIFILIFIYIIIILNDFAYTQNFWEKITMPQLGEINNLYFINENIAFCCHNEGFSKTIDGGITWENITINKIINQSFNSLLVFDENRLFIGGDSLYYTENGGFTWLKKTLSNQNGKIKKIIKLKDGSIILLTTKTNYGQLYKSNDMGNNWRIVFELNNKDIYDLDFYDSLGILVGKDKSVIYRSSDYGENWIKSNEPTLLYTNYTRSDIRTVKFVDQNTIFAAGWGSYIGLQKTIILLSTDGGFNWKQLDLRDSNAIYSNVYSSFVINNTWFLGGGFSYDGSILLIKKESDSSFVRENIPFGFTINCFAANQNAIYAGGENGAIIRSTDLGDTWILLENHLNVPYYDIDIKGNNIFIAGFNGAFIKSEDSGKKWIKSYISNSLTSPRVNDLFFINENIGYAAKAFGGISKTTNSGNTWFSVLKDTMLTTASNDGVFFIDSNNGFVCGRISNNYDVIYKTTDGGFTWQKKEKIFSKNLYSIAFFNLNEGIIVGSNTLIAYTTNSGESWLTSTFLDNIPTNLILRSVEIIDDSTAIVLGGSYLLISYDKGKNWKLKANLTGFELYKSTFINSYNGYVCGFKVESGKYYSKVFETTDGGQNWENIFPTEFDNLNFQAYSLKASENGELYVIGSRGLVFVRRNNVSVEKTNKYDKDFVIYQNYPNPFNSGTNLVFYLPVADRVNVKIQNILGQKILELNDYYKEGKNIIPLNFTNYNLSSGIYIYYIEYQGIIQSKKMIYLK